MSIHSHICLDMWCILLFDIRTLWFEQLLCGFFQFPGLFACKNQPTCITDTVWYMVYIYISIWVGSFWLKRASFSHMAFGFSLFGIFWMSKDRLHCGTQCHYESLEGLSGLLFPRWLPAGLCRSSIFIQIRSYSLGYLYKRRKFKRIIQLYLLYFGLFVSFVFISPWPKQRKTLTAELWLW